MTLDKKYEKLIEYLKSLGSVAVAFSGGVDSAFLLYAAKQALGERVVAVTAQAPAFCQKEQREAREFCERYGIRQVSFDFSVMTVPGFVENPENRCYFCKRAMLKGMLYMAKKEGMEHLLEGSNLDDDGDYRPGLQAVAELPVKSPLRELEFTKSQIRELSRKLELPTWDKPSAACLASRFAYGEPITEERLRMVEQAEDFLRELGFSQFRVRLHGNLARIEVLPQEFENMMKLELREKIHNKLRELGFSYVTLDLLGYRVGSMNETILTNPSDTL